MNDPKNLPRYTSEQVTSILSDALDRRDAGEGRISHEELFETAREIGVTTAQMESAIAEALRFRAERSVVQAKRRRMLRVFYVHAAAYVVVSALLFTLAFPVLGAGIYAIVVAWGIGLAFHGARVLASRSVPEREADTNPGRLRGPDESAVRPRRS